MRIKGPDLRMDFQRSGSSLAHLWRLTTDGTDVVGGTNFTTNTAVTFIATPGSPPANMPATVANFVAASNSVLSVLDTDNALDLQNPFTINLWVRPTGNFAALPFGIYSKGSLGASGYQAFNPQANPGINFRVGGLPDSPGIFFINVWHMITQRLSPGPFNEAFLNGVGSGSPTTNPLSFNNTAFLLGRLQEGFSWEGQMSDLRIYNTALTNAQITALYNNGAGVFTP